MRTQTEFSLLFSVGIFLIFQISGTIALNKDTQYTPREKEALKKLKPEIASIQYAEYQKLDSYLMHFLRRKNLDVETIKLLNENHKWRKDQKIDTILKEKNMINMEKGFPVTVDGVDKEGRPTLSYILNKWDIRRFILAGRGDEFNRYQIYIMEKIQQKVYELALAGKDVSQFNILIDMSGFNTRQHACLPCLQGLSGFVPLIEAYYPNSSNSVIFVNVPRAFETVIGLIKGFMDPAQQRLLQVYGYNKAEWRRVIEKMYDDDQVSTAFGGTRTKRLTV